MYKFKVAILFLFLGVSIYSFSQKTEHFSLSIIDAESKETIPFATVHLLNNPDIGWVSDLRGSIPIKNNQLAMIQKDSLVVKSLGYFRKVMGFKQLELDDFKVYLQAQEFQLSEVIIKPSENLAIKTIKNAIAKRKQNSPSSINYFSCEKYNKTTIDIVPNKKYFSESELEIISSGQQQKHLLISEKYSENKFENGEMTNESISSYRLSGFREPKIEDITTQIQPFHFYDPIITLFENTYINPISKSGLSNYGYQISDTIYKETDTLVAIEYFPKSINKSLLKGILHISLKNYAIAGVTAEPVIQDLLSLKIEQEYIQENNHYLPLKLNYVLSFKKYPSKKYGFKMESYTHIEDYQFNTSENLTSMDKLRSFKLTPKEQFTYKWTDSLGLAENFDGKLNFLNKFSQAKIPFKIIDFDLSQLQYNLHERHRIGIGAFTNEKLSKRFTVGGYFAYGTGDKQNKYGALLSYKLLKPKIEIETSYKTDLTERGAISNQTYVKPDYWRNMMKDSLNRVESYGFSVKKNYKNSSVLVGIKKERIEDLNFSLEKSDFSEIYFSAKINFNKLEQKFFEPNNLSYKYPLFYFTYLKGLNTGEGDFSYSRISLSLDHSYYLERLGKQSIFITYEKLSGNKKLPYYKLITGYGANSTSLPFFAAKYFQTMLPYQFTHTESIVLHFNHSFLKPLFYSKLSEPKISLLQSAGWGRNNQSEVKQFKTFDRGYFESGLSIENIIKINYRNFAYMGVGAGIFTSYGEHVSKNIADNLVFKVNLSVVF